MPLRDKARFPRIVDRVVQQRRTEAAAPADEREDLVPQLAALQERVDHLESLIEGLQDSVHRVSVRQTAEAGRA
jgi:uncharacterized protein YlxW (UPF0749 family)